MHVKSYTEPLVFITKWSRVLIMLLLEGIVLRCYYVRHEASLLRFFCATSVFFIWWPLGSLQYACYEFVVWMQLLKRCRCSLSTFFAVFHNTKSYAQYWSEATDRFAMHINSCTKNTTMLHIFSVNSIELHCRKRELIFAMTTGPSGLMDIPHYAVREGRS